MNSHDIALLALALTPGFAICVYIFWRDRHQPEPLPLLFYAFVLGIIAVVPVLISGTVINHKFPDIMSGDLFELAAYAFLGVACIEEGIKFILMRLVIWRLPEFDEPFDGIIYSVMISMGFAVTENVLYVFNTESYGHAYETVLIRAFTAIPAHATFAILMGFFLGLARFIPERAFLLQIAGMFTAVLFHGLYDFFLFTNEITGTIIGAIISLWAAILLSRQALLIHSNISKQMHTERED
jgi:protease PrsW